MTKTDQIPMVDKLTVSDLHFPAEDVLKDSNAIKERSIKLHNATSLGNLNKHKVVITFEDDTSQKRVHTTIWAITDQKVLLKAGRAIPINRIHQVSLT
jgi:hypothetical protein